MCKANKVATMNTPAKILIVDDEEVVRLSYMRILAGTNCKVKTAWTWGQVTEAMQARSSMSCCWTCACRTWME